MDYKQLRHNFINYLKDNYNYARPEVMASNVFYAWHNNIGIDFWDIFKSDESMERAKELLIKQFEKTGRKNPRGHAGVHYGCWQKFQEFLIKQQDGCYAEGKDINHAEYLDTYADSSEFDLLTVMDNLSLKRKLFHSEADFQFALAWEIQTLYPEAAVRLEYCPREAQHMHIDIVVELDDKVYPIELKYKTLKLDCPIEGEYYNLKSHGAQDIGKYDCLLDIQRMEQCRKILSRFECGFTIWLANDPLYWMPAKKPGTMAEEFTLHEGVCKSGIMRWAAHTSAGTQKGREEPISLHGSYSIHWRDYSQISETRAGKLRYHYNGDERIISNGSQLQTGGKLSFRLKTSGGMIEPIEKVSVIREVSNGGTDSHSSHQEIYIKGRNEDSDMFAFKRDLSYYGTHLLRCQIRNSKKGTITRIFKVIGV